MQCLKSFKGCTRKEQIKSKDIGSELKMWLVQNKIEVHRQNWINWVNHVDRMAGRKYQFSAVTVETCTKYFPYTILNAFCCRFDIIKKLGQGTYGKVQLGINKETGQEVNA